MKRALGLEKASVWGPGISLGHGAAGQVRRLNPGVQLALDQGYTVWTGRPRQQLSQSRGQIPKRYAQKICQWELGSCSHWPDSQDLGLQTLPTTKESTDSCLGKHSKQPSLTSDPNEALRFDEELFSFLCDRGFKKPSWESHLKDNLEERRNSLPWQMSGLTLAPGSSLILRLRTFWLNL